MQELIREIVEKAKPEILEIIKGVYQSKNYKDNLKISKKEDNSIVTEVDLKVSKLIESLLDSKKDMTLFCEENHNSFEYPMAILDPIDGTRGLANGMPECVVSLALKGTNKLEEGSAWIFNPFNGFEVISDSSFISPPKEHEGPLLGMVSRSEWEKSLFKNFENGMIGSQSYSLYPKGSIGLSILKEEISHKLVFCFFTVI